MSAAMNLERRYRRLLGCYPARHRGEHAEEMLGVLMADARDGQRRPGLADTANLLWGSLLIRLRPGATGTADPDWRDALALFSVVAPLFILAGDVVTYGLQLVISGLLVSGAAVHSLFFLVVVLALHGQLVLVILLACRLRRCALALSGAQLILLGVLFSMTPTSFVYPNLPLVLNMLFVLTVEVAALAGSPGPQRAFQLLKRRHLALVLAGGALLGLSRADLLTDRRSVLWRLFTSPGLHLAVAVLLALAVLVLAAASSLSRHLLLLLAIPGYVLALTYLPYTDLSPAHLTTAGYLAVICLPPLALAALAATAAVRGHQGEGPALPGS